MIDAKKSKRWREARARNLREQIASTRKKIAFWRSLGAIENEAQARRDMISLKSKLADVTRPR